MKMIDPKNDIVFKTVFSNENGHAALISLVNAIIVNRGNEEIKEIEIFGETDFSKDVYKKRSTLRLIGYTERKKKYIIGIELRDGCIIGNRVLGYWSTLIHDNFKTEEEFENANVNIISINITNGERETKDHYYSDYGFRNQDGVLLPLENIEIHMLDLINLPQEIRVKEGQYSLLDLWGILLHSGRNEYCKEVFTNFLSNKNETVENKDILTQFYDQLTQISEDQELMNLIEKRTQFLDAYSSGVEAARKIASILTTNTIKDNFKKMNITFPYSIENILLQGNDSNFKDLQLHKTTIKQSNSRFEVEQKSFDSLYIEVKNKYLGEYLIEGFIGGDKATEKEFYNDFLHAYDEKTNITKTLLIGSLLNQNNISLENISKVTEVPFNKVLDYSRMFFGS
ncbi:hypothetical protein bcgnr5390_09850 [Bacillus luti]|nr:hypothetical protein BC2903_31060 [Bacillus cereus]